MSADPFPRRPLNHRLPDLHPFVIISRPDKILLANLPNSDSFDEGCRFEGRAPSKWNMFGIIHNTSKEREP